MLLAEVLPGRRAVTIEAVLEVLTERQPVGGDLSIVREAVGFELGEPGGEGGIVGTSTTREPVLVVAASRAIEDPRTDPPDVRCDLEGPVGVAAPLANAVDGQPGAHQGSSGRGHAR